MNIHTFSHAIMISDNWRIIIILLASLNKPMKDAIKEVKDGVILDLEISAGAKGTAVRGYNPWRRRIEVRLSEKAQKGRANEQLISFLSDLFIVNARNVEIISGSTNSKKSVKISGLNTNSALKILSENDGQRS